jgi:hypothetical protein
VTHQLNTGELAQHFRYPGSRQLACGVSHGAVTGLLEEIGCDRCREVTDLAAQLAAECGCRHDAVHRHAARRELEPGWA